MSDCDSFFPYSPECELHFVSSTVFQTEDTITQVYSIKKIK